MTGARTGRPTPTPYLPGRGVRPDDAVLASPDPMAWASDLFDGGCYWEANEVWERLWIQRPRDTPEGRFVQGLILMAACLLKQEVGSADAAEQLFYAGVEALEEVVYARGDVVEGVDLLSLVSAVDMALHGGPPPRLTEG